MTGSQEVSGSIPLISTTKNLEAATASRFFHVYGKLHKAVFVLNYKFFAISFISGRCLVTHRRCRPPWCHPKKSYLHCLIGKAGRYPIEYHNTSHIFLSPNSLFVTAPRLDIRCISAPPSENCSGRVRWNGSSARSRCLRWPWPAPDTGPPSCRPRKRSS